MSVLVAVMLTLVGVAGTAVVLAREQPFRQAVLLGLSGLVMAGLFVVVQAPDVALSQIVIGGVALPLLLLFSLARIRAARTDREERRDGAD